MDEEEAEEMQAEALDAHKVVLITPADLRFNLEKKSTQRSKRQVGIEEVNRVLGLGESGFISLLVRPLLSFSSPVLKAKEAIPKAEKTLESVFVSANKGGNTEEMANTPRLPFEVPQNPSAKALIMNIDSEGTSPTVQQITRPIRGRSFLRLPAENKAIPKELEVTSWALSISPAKKAEIPVPTPSPREPAEPIEDTVEYTTIQTPDLHMENSLSDMILPTNPKEPPRRKRKKRVKNGLFIRETGTGPLVALTPQAGRLIQVREYVITNIDDQYSPIFPSLYSPDVHKALSSFGSSSRRRRLVHQSNSPGDYYAFRNRQKDYWRTPDSLGSLKHGAMRGDSREQLLWSGGQMRKTSMRVL